MNEYAKHLLKRNKEKLSKGTARKPAGRPRMGSVLAGKKQTVWEAGVTSSMLVFHKTRWAELFAKPLNKCPN